MNPTIDDFCGIYENYIDYLTDIEISCCADSGLSCDQCPYRSPGGVPLD